MKICVLIDAWEPLWGGGQTHVWENSKLLVNKYHHKIDIFTRKLISDGKTVYLNNEEYYQGRLKIIRIGPVARFFSPIVRIIWLISVIIKVCYQNKQEKFDLIHAHAYLSGIPGIILSKILNIPIVFTVHGSNLLDLNKKTPMYYLEKFILTQIKYDREISVSKSFLKYKNINKNIEVIPNGVNIKDFDKVKKLKNNKFTFLWVGRFDKVKGLTILIDAFDKLLRKNIKVILILVGDGPEKQDIQKIVKKYQIEKAITFKPKVNYKKIVKIYHQADVFVLPSLTEGQPITLLEAMAAKLPIIATNVGDNAEFIKNRVNGMLIDPDNVNQLYKVMLQIYRNDKLDELGNKGYMLVKSNYSWLNSVIKLESVYKNLKHD